MAESIEAIAAMIEREEQAVGRHQRGIERVVSLITLPGFSMLALIVLTLWIVLNSWLPALGVTRWDSPPFPWLQVAVSTAAFLLASMILASQNRQAKIAERRAHIDLQVNLLVDRKVGKVIQLLEEMRRDSPHLRDRPDSEAVALQATADPVVVAEILASRLDETVG